MNQRAIEDYVGIDARIATFMMSSSSPKAETAMNLLRMAVARPEQGVLGLLKCAVDECNSVMIVAGGSD